MTAGAYEWRIANIKSVDVSIHRASICSMIRCCVVGSTTKPNAGPDRCWIILGQSVLPSRGWVRAVTLEKLWTVDQLAEFAGVSVTTLYHWRWEGKGPKAIKVGRYLRYRECDIEKWLEVLGSEVA